MLKVHFLNVGHGECTIVEHPSGHLSMIDINNSQDYDSESWKEYRMERGSTGTLLTAGLLGEALMRENAKKELTNPIEFLKAHYPGKRLFRFVLTHPDLDHMRGLKRLSAEVGFDNFWDVQHTKTVPTFRSDDDKRDWLHYQSLRSTKTAAGPHNFLRGHAAFAFAQDEHGQPGGDNIEILSPTPALITSCNSSKKSNDLSYVLRVYHAGRSILLTGDVESEGWSDMHRAYGKSLKTDILQASHHGRDSGYHLESLQHIAPSTIVVSVGRKASTDATRKYCGQCDQVLSTRYYGNLRVEIDDAGNIKWFAQRNGS